MAGEGNKMGMADYANAALGVTSLIKGLTTKKPKRFSPAPYVANIRPAQGNEESLKRIKNDIAGQVASAGNDVTQIAGSDTNSGILARLGIQSNANKAIATAESENAKLYQQDLNRVSQEKNEESIFNTQMKNHADMIKADLDQRDYAATQTAAASGVQSAIQYEANRQADIRNKFAAQESGNQGVEAVAEAHWNDSYNEAIRMGKTPEEAASYADAAKSKRNFSRFKSNFYSSPRIFGRARQ